MIYNQNTYQSPYQFYTLMLPKHYYESEGGNVMAKAPQNLGKTCFIVHLYKYLIDNHGFNPVRCVGNLTILNPKYNGGYYIERDKDLEHPHHYILPRNYHGFQTLKGDNLRQFLWDMTHKPYRNVIAIIDEIDTEFPARFFQDREQTEIALRLWHNMKLRNWVLMTSHDANLPNTDGTFNSVKATDAIFEAASQYRIIPHGINWLTGNLDFTLQNGLDKYIKKMTAYNVIETMDDYDRWEMTENTSEDSLKERPIAKNKKEKPSEKVKRDGVEKLKKVIKQSSDVNRIARNLL